MLTVHLDTSRLFLLLCLAPPRFRIRCLGVMARLEGDLGWEAGRPCPAPPVLCCVLLP